MRLGQWIIVLMLTGMYALASAGVFRYVDEKGDVHYTDDLTNVPVEQWPKEVEYEEPVVQSKPEEEAEGKGQEAESAKKALKEKKAQEKALGEKLGQTGEKLEAEYQDLKKEREELDKIATKRLKRAEYNKLLKRVKDFNSRTEDYENRRKAFEKEVEDYNASIKKDIEVQELR